MFLAAPLVEGLDADSVSSTLKTIGISNILDEYILE